MRISGPSRTRHSVDRVSGGAAHRGGGAPTRGAARCYAGRARRSRATSGFGAGKRTPAATASERPHTSRRAFTARLIASLPQLDPSGPSAAALVLARRGGGLQLHRGVLLTFIWFRTHRLRSDAAEHILASGASTPRRVRRRMNGWCMEVHPPLSKWLYFAARVQQVDRTREAADVCRGNSRKSAKIEREPVAVCEIGAFCRYGRTTPVRSPPVAWIESYSSCAT